MLIRFSVKTAKELVAVCFCSVIHRRHIVHNVGQIL